jgi:hypothetical protein
MTILHYFFLRKKWKEKPNLLKYSKGKWVVPEQDTNEVFVFFAVGQSEFSGQFAVW